MQGVAHALEIGFSRDLVRGWLFDFKEFGHEESMVTALVTAAKV
jgi:hypothetical protein